MQIPHHKIIFMKISSITTLFPNETKIIASHIVVCLLIYFFIIIGNQEERRENIVFPFLIKCIFPLKQKQKVN